MTEHTPHDASRRDLLAAAAAMSLAAGAPAAAEQPSSPARAMAGKPSIVFAHGLWADGSCFSKLVPTLQAEGHEVICSQHGLDSLSGDVDCVVRCFGQVSG
ncbi:MAG TPA: hypothetical protein VKQ70_07530, partial [Caulobacteraceae bacterium]|nr:hypothetical protein [Caulobacteraceae bacterium]